MNRRTFLFSCTAVAGTPLLSALVADRVSAAPAAMKNITLPPIPAVHIDDAFWAPKFAVWRNTTFNDSFDKFEKTGALDNFDRVAAGMTGGHHGDPWWDGLVYEMIAAAADFLANTPDPDLERRVDGYIDRIAAAAAVDADGYLNTAVTLAHVAPRWSATPPAGGGYDDRFPHTVYNAGCLVEAGVHYQRATGKTKLLLVATRMANFMCGIIGPPPKQNVVPGHAIGEMSFLDLARLYRDNPALRAPMNALGDGEPYSKLAQFWIDNRGNHVGRAGMEAYDQDDRPVAEQPALEGHAVRAALLAAGIARGAVVADRADYLQIGERWWNNMVEAKEYVTGGLGAIPAFEGFGPDFELPNNGYCETCAAVAGAMFDGEMFLATGQAKYIDAFERALYNGVLSGVGLGGDSYFYTNYLASGPETRRWTWHGCPCCPPMFLKLMGSLPGRVYATAADALYVNLYAAGAAALPVTGQHVRVEQATEYPWNGAVRLTLHPESPAKFALRLRIPAWSANATATLNGNSIAARPGADGYLTLDRIWESGDTVGLTFPTPVRRVYADPRVAADSDRVALMRGPVVYCVEGLDCGAPVHSLALLTDAALAADHQPSLLGGVTTLSGQAQLVRSDDSAAVPTLTPTAFTAIPYYAHDNREPTTMAVWLAEKPSVAAVLTPASAATATASHVNPTDTVNALNDGVLPHASDDDSIPRFTWWDHRGTAEWVRYDLPNAQRLTGVEVYWWDERRVGHDCRVPQSWTVEYKTTAGDWEAVANPTAYGVDLDKFNRTTFDAVETTGLRLSVQMQPNWSAGILEWRLIGAPT